MTFLFESLKISPYMLLTLFFSQKRQKFCIKEKSTDYKKGLSITSLDKGGLDDHKRVNTREDGACKGFWLSLGVNRCFILLH